MLRTSSQDTMLQEPAPQAQDIDIGLEIERLQSNSKRGHSTQSIFRDSVYDSKFQSALSSAARNDLKEKDVSDMLSAQRAYERFGCCRCCTACTVLLTQIIKIKLILFNFIFCATGLLISYYLIPDLELANRIWFYTIYFSFLFLCISIAKVITHYVMKLLVHLTRNSWHVFYVKNIRNRLYLSLLSTCWFTGFYFFGRFVNYPYNPTIFRMVMCVLLSSAVFLVTHIFIRFTALNSYFDIFKVRTRKLKTFIHMIEMMANLDERRKGNHISENKRLLSLPIMNFLIDFPSEEDHAKAKQQNKSSVAFSLVKEDHETAEEIADAISKRIFHDPQEVMTPMRQWSLETIDEKKEEKVEEQQEEVEAQAVEEEEEAKDKEQQQQSLSLWLDSEFENASVRKALAALNICSVQDLEYVLSDLYRSAHREEFAETFVDKEWMKKLEEDMRNQGMSYSEWVRFRGKTYEDFKPKIKLLCREEKRKKQKLELDKLKRDIAAAKLKNEAEDAAAHDDIDEVDEILNMKYDLYSIRLSGSTQSIKLISDDELNKLTRVLSYLIMISLNGRKQKLFRAREIKRKEGKGGRKESDDPQPAHLPQSGDTLRKYGVQDVFMNKEWLELDEYKDNQRINKKIFVKIFQRANHGNRGLLRSLGEFAWKKFGPQNKNKDLRGEKSDLDVMYLNGHIFNIFKDLLLLKKTIDSYTIIIINLQRMVDVITPLLLLFVYLYIFNFDFADTLGLYISIVGVIAFFGQSYFSSVFSSISFVMALNPFLVGDYIMYKEEVYLVTEISLISCTFKWLKTGSLYTFQNEQLSKSAEPIINLSRSELTKTKYRWYCFMKNSVTNQDLTAFKKRCKQLISQHKTMKNENWGSIKCRSNDMEGFTKKKVNIQMKYDRYDSDVNSVGFNCCTQAMIELNLHWEPLPLTINLNTRKYP
eukprot:374934_1